MLPIKIIKSNHYRMDHITPSPNAAASTHGRGLALLNNCSYVYPSFNSSNLSTCLSFILQFLIELKGLNFKNEVFLNLWFSSLC